MNRPDRRLNAFRPDLADQRLKGQVEASRFIDGYRAQVCVAVLDIRNAPGAEAGLDTQLLLGDTVTVFDDKDGFAWVQSEADHYVGYVPSSGLGAPGKAATHTIAVSRSFLYSQADMKRPARAALSLGSRLVITGETETRGSAYSLLENGEAVMSQHLRSIDETVTDYVAIAEMLERTPYLWGGKSAFGIDCSGLVQLSLRMAGHSAPRDTDMQAAALGQPLHNDETLQRGDLVLWKGHVAIMLDANEVIHASGHAMMVVRESLQDAIARIEPFYGRPTGFRRP